MAKKNATGLRRLLRALDLPEETDARVPKFTMLGSSDLLIENHSGILQYDRALVRLMTPEGVVRVAGAELELTEFGGERVYLRGKIAGWCYEGRNGCGIS